jgi:hypothetical protein
LKSLDYVYKRRIDRTLQENSTEEIWRYLRRTETVNEFLRAEKSILLVVDGSERTRDGEAPAYSGVSRFAVNLALKWNDRCKPQARGCVWLPSYWLERTDAIVVIQQAIGEFVKESSAPFTGTTQAPMDFGVLLWLLCELIRDELKEHTVLLLVDSVHVFEQAPVLQIVAALTNIMREEPKHPFKILITSMRPFRPERRIRDFPSNYMVRETVPEHILAETEADPSAQRQQTKRRDTF